MPAEAGSGSPIHRTIGGHMSSSTILPMNRPTWRHDAMSLRISPGWRADQTFGRRIVGAAPPIHPRLPQAEKPAFERREIDPLPQCNKFSTGEFVALVELFNDFEEICSRQVGRPRIPLPEFRFEPGEICRSGQLIGLQDLPQVLRSHRIHSPELQHFPPGNDAVANPDEFIEDRQRSLCRRDPTKRTAQPRCRSARRRAPACGPLPETALRR